MIKTYATPAAFQDALNQQAKAIAKQQGGDVAAIMRGFYFQRLTARVFKADPEGWLLKGGQALLVRYPSAARLSKDIDLQRIVTDSNNEEALAALLGAAAIDLGDFLKYLPGRLDPHGTGNGGVNQAFEVFIGNRKVDTVHVDVVVRHNITATPQTVRLTPRPELPWPRDWPTIRLYPLMDHLADKICAMYEWHGDTPSGRYRDLADVLLISQNETFESGAAHHALHSEAALRRTYNGPELRLPERFEMPHSSWRSGYIRAAADVGGLEGCKTWETAHPAADAFLTPLLGPAFIATWDPKRIRWIYSQDLHL